MNKKESMKAMTKQMKISKDKISDLMHGLKKNNKWIMSII